MMSICYRYENNRDDAKATVNICFLKVVINLEKYKKEIPFKLWVRRITINTIIDEYRKNKKAKESTSIVDFQTEIKEYTSHEINSYLTKIDAEEIYELVNGLPDMPKKIFNLYVVDGFDHNEIAVMLDIPSGTSRWHLSVAKEELKNKLIKLQGKKYKSLAS